jgi:predicted RNase H-like nuclease (RuvC/YqgF family)
MKYSPEDETAYYEAMAKAEEDAYYEAQQAQAQAEYEYEMEKAREIGRLVDELESEISYHEDCIDKLQGRIQELLRG